MNKLKKIIAWMVVSIPVIAYIGLAPAMCKHEPELAFIFYGIPLIVIIFCGVLILLDWAVGILIND